MKMKTERYVNSKKTLKNNNTGAYIKQRMQQKTEEKKNNCMKETDQKIIEACISC